MKDTLSKVTHEFPPVFDSGSKILILGSFPSVKSREQHFYYGHPQNRFWKVLSGVLDCPVPEKLEEKQKMLLAHHIALWDVIAECEIIGSKDSSIQNVKINDLNRLLAKTQIDAIFLNGGTAFKLYQKYAARQITEEAFLLPSTSPANAAWSLERLIESYEVIKQYL